MRFHLFSAIIYIVLLSLPLFSWGRENLLNPTVLARPGLNTNPSKCQIINVYSYALSGEKIYAQVGVGWAIQEESKQFHIILPAHVIAGADLIIGRCGQQEFPLFPRSKSETMDLAMLDVSNKVAPYLFPMINFEDRLDYLKRIPKEEYKKVASVIPNYEPDVLKKAEQHQTRNFYFYPSEKPNEPNIIMDDNDPLFTAGYSHSESRIPSLYVDALAIRPGFSGSPFFIQPDFPWTFQNAKRAIFLERQPADAYNFTYLFGMLTKAEINGSRSVGISIQDILNTLPKLLSSSDPDAGLKLRLRYTEKVNGGVLERQQELIQTLPDGSQRIYTEVCNTSMAESSEWVMPNKQPSDKTKDVLKTLSIDSQSIKKMNYEETLKVINDLQKSKTGITQQRTGGDYGEGGGSLLALKNAIFMTPWREEYGWRSFSGFKNDSHSSYKAKKNCEQPMIQDQHDKKFDSINISGRTIKTTTLNELLTALTKSDTGRNSCVTTNISFDSTQPRTFFGKNKEYVYYRYDNPADRQKPDQFIQCNGTSTRVKFEGENLIVDVNLSKDSPSSGFIRILPEEESTACEIKLSSANTRPIGNWKYQIRTKDVDIEFGFGNEDRVLGFKILRASPACNPFKNQGNLWMYEANFKSTRTIIRRWTNASEATSSGESEN